jgi:hypothetical protein
MIAVGVAATFYLALPARAEPKADDLQDSRVRRVLCTDQYRLDMSSQERQLRQAMKS